MYNWGKERFLFLDGLGGLKYPVVSLVALHAGALKVDAAHVGAGAGQPDVAQLGRGQSAPPGGRVNQHAHLPQHQHAETYRRRRSQHHEDLIGLEGPPLCTSHHWCDTARVLYINGFFFAFFTFTYFSARAMFSWTSEWDEFVVHCH